MPIDKITAAQFQQLIQAGITSRNATHDTAYGPIRDIVIDPVASVLAQQNDRARRISLLLSLLNANEFSEADLNAFVYNESMLRLPGAVASATLTFTADLLPSSNLVVPRGFPVATAPDAATGQSITFVTTEEATLIAADAAAGRYSRSSGNTVYEVYELSVPAVSTTVGTLGRVGARRINRPLRPMAGFQKVENQQAAVDGVDPETNDELIERFLLAVVGRQLATKGGVQRFILSSSPSISDVHIVHGDNPFLTRAGSDAGAVDAFIIGSAELQQTDSLTYLGAGQVMSITRPPLLTVTSVRRVSPAVTYTSGVDFEVVFDTSGVAGSTRAVEGVRFLAGGTLPTIGDLISVTYTYNNLVRSVQATANRDENKVIGQDLLVRQGIEVGVTLSARMTVVAGADPNSTRIAVEDALTNFFSSLGLGDDVEASDLQAVVRRISAVDNFVITNLNRATTSGTSTADLVINDNEYARLANVAIT